MRVALPRALACGLCLAVWLLLLLLSSASARAADDGATHVIADARFLLADEEAPAPDGRGWAPVKLPDNWSVTRRQAEGLGWYRMTLDLGHAPPGRIGILVQRLSMNGEFFVNGVRVLSGGRMAEPVARRWNTPFFVEVPAPLLHAGANTLDVRIYAYRNQQRRPGQRVLG